MRAGTLRCARRCLLVPCASVPSSFALHASPAASSPLCASSHMLAFAPCCSLPRLFPCPNRCRCPPFRVRTILTHLCVPLYQSIYLSICPSYVDVPKGLVRRTSLASTCAYIHRGVSTPGKLTKSLDPSVAGFKVTKCFLTRPRIHFGISCALRTIYGW
jgi:hypothetical protein